MGEWVGEGLGVKDVNFISNQKLPSNYYKY